MYSTSSITQAEHDTANPTVKSPPSILRCRLSLLFRTRRPKSGKLMATPPRPPPYAVSLVLIFAAAACGSPTQALLFSSFALPLPGNSSYLLASPAPDLPRRAPSFLREVVRVLSAKERWDPEAEVRMADLDSRGATAGVAQRYEFTIRVGSMALNLKIYDEPVLWRKVDGVVVEFGSDVVAGDGAAKLKPAVRLLELVGPLELVAGSDGGDDDRISLHLPSSNITLIGLRRIVVGNGIKVKIEGAKEVCLSHPHDIGLLLDGSLGAHVKDYNKFWYLGSFSCPPLLSVRIVGAGSVLAGNNADNIEVAFTTYDNVELLPRKCYISGHVRQMSSCPFCSISSTLGLFDELLRAMLGDVISQHTSVRFIEAKITSAVLIKCKLQLERDLTKNNNRLEKVPEWKQKPKVEQIWLEVIAKVEGGSRLKPVVVGKVMRPYVIADSISLSSLLNISFTKLSSFVVPPEALTLDVRW